MSDLLAVGLGFLLGARHGAEPDHLAAVAALSARGGSRREILRLAGRFAAGHAAILVLVGGALAAFEIGGALPPWVARAGEVAAGAMLLAVGLAALRGSGGYVHSHVHAHDGGVFHAHPHPHRGLEHGLHDHAHRAAAIGGAFALASLPSHLANVAPVLAARGPLGRAACIGAFGAGILASMAACGWATGAASSALSRPERLARGASLAAVAAGLLVCARNLFG